MAKMTGFKNFLNGTLTGRPSDDGSTEIEQIDLRARILALIAFFVPLVIFFLLGCIGIKVPFVWQLISCFGLSILVLVLNSLNYFFLISTIFFIALSPTVLYFLICLLFKLKFDTGIAKILLIIGGILVLILMFPEIFKGIFKGIIDMIKAMIGFLILFVIILYIIVPAAKGIDYVYKNITMFSSQHPIIFCYICVFLFVFITVGIILVVKFIKQGGSIKDLILGFFYSCWLFFETLFSNIKETIKKHKNAKQTTTLSNSSAIEKQESKCNSSKIDIDDEIEWED